MLNRYLEKIAAYGVSVYDYKALPLAEDISFRDLGKSPVRAPIYQKPYSHITPLDYTTSSAHKRAASAFEMNLVHNAKRLVNVSKIPLGISAIGAGAGYLLARKRQEENTEHAQAN